MKKTIIFLLLFASLSSSSQNYILPRIPDNLINDGERLEYLVIHYWDNYDFEDPYIFLEGDIMLNYFSFLRIVPYSISNESIIQTLESASKSNQIFSLFIDTYRVYLLNPESFFCDYERYLAVAEFVIANEQIQQSKKNDFLLEKKIINTNRIGNKATDFIVVDRNDNPIELYSIETDYTLVFFHNPNCGFCVENKNALSESFTVNRMIEAGKLTVFAVCPYDEFELWSSSSYPRNWLSGFDRGGRINREKVYYFFESSSLYLLDKDKRVLKKDIRLDLLEEYLSNLTY